MKTNTLYEMCNSGLHAQGTNTSVTQKGHWYKTAAKILMLFIALFAMNIGQAWGAGTTAKTISEGDQYYSALREAKTNLSSNNWVTTDGSPGSSSSSYTAPSGWLSGASGAEGYGWMTVQSSKTVTFTVTNITGVSILGAANSSSRDLILSVKTGGVEVGTAATSKNTSVHVLEYGSTLDKTKTYTITISASTANNAKFHQIKFVGASAGGGCTPITPSLSYASTTLTVGGGNSATPTVTGNTGSGAVTYSSSNTSVATVNSSTGVVTPVAAGSATITASIAANGGYCANTATATFTIAAGAIDCSSPGTIFSAETSATANVSIAASTTRALTASEATVDGGTMTVINQQTSAKNLIAKSGSTWWFSHTNNNTFFKADLDCALAAGDVITIDAVGASGGRGVWVSTATSRPGSAPACSGTTESTGQAVNYTVTSSDEYVGKSTLYFYRATSNTTYFNNINITRPGPCTPITPSLSYASTSLTVGAGNSATPTVTGNTGSGAVTYSSSNTSVATVNSSTGVVTPVAAGSATITASIAANGGYCANTATAPFTIAAAAVTYTVTFNANGGTCGTASLTQGSAGASIAMPTPTLSGYTCTGWYTAATGGTKRANAGASYTPTSNETVYAQYQQTVTLKTGSQGSGADKTPTVLYKGTALTGFTAHTADGYTLQGYYTDASDGTKVLNADGSFAGTAVASYITDGKWTKTGATTLFAQWVAAGGGGGGGCSTIGSITAAATTDLGSGNTPRYVVDATGIGRLMKNKTGSSAWSLTSGTYLQTSSSAFGLQTYNDISEIVVYGAGTGGNRTLSKVEVGTTTSNYAEVTASATTEGTDDGKFTTSGTADSMHIAVEAAANSYIFITFSGNVNISSVKFINCGTEEWFVKGEMNEWGEDDQLEGSGTLTATIALAANTRYEFKIYDKTNDTWYGNTGAIPTNISNWTYTSGGDNSTLYTGPAGDYTFSFNTSTKQLSITYPEVDHPNANYVYFIKGGGWSDVRLYNYTTESNRMSDWGGSPVIGTTTTICGTSYYYCAAYFNNIIFRDGGSNQSNTMSLDRGKYLDETTHASAWSNFSTYSITFNANGGTGSMAAHAGICSGGSQTLRANTFENDGKVFTGWNTADDGSGTSYADGATISSITSNITLYAQWLTCPEYGDLFTLEFSVASAKSFDSKESIPLGSYGTATGGTVTLTNNSATEGKAQLTTTGGGSFYFNGNDAYIKIDLACALQAGDIITFTNPSNANQICFTTTATRTTTEATVSNTYTVAEDGALDGATTIYVWRSTSSGTYVHTINIERPVNILPLESGTLYHANVMVASSITSLTASNQYASGLSSNSRFFSVGDASAADGAAGTMAAISFDWSIWDPTAPPSAVTGKLKVIGASNITDNTPTSRAIKFKVDHAGILEVWAQNSNVISFAKEGVAGSKIGTGGAVTYQLCTVNISEAGTYYLYGNATSTNGGVAAVRFTNTYTYNVTYNGNGNTGGTVPTDATDYSSGDMVTVLGNTGSLVKTGYAFNGWNTSADGSGTAYAAGATFSITANTTLYAQWVSEAGCETLAKGTATSITAMETNVGTITISGASSASETFVGVKLGGSSAYIQLTPKSGSSFAVGDILTVEVGSTKATTVGYRIGSGSATATTFTLTAAGTHTFEHELVSEDIVDGSVKIFRNGSEDRFAMVMIEHCDGCTDLVPAITGTLTACATTTLTATNYTDGATLQWYRNGTEISGATSSTYAATTSGTYTVSASKNCVKTSDGAVVTINNAVTTVVAAGETEYEVGDAATALTISATGATDFGWERYNGSSWVSASETNSYTPSTAAEGTTRYRGKAKNSCNDDWVYSAEKVVNVANHGTVTASWKVDDVAATGDAATVNSGGWYEVKATFSTTDATPTLSMLTGGVLLDNIVVEGTTIKGRVHVPETGVTLVEVSAQVPATASWKAKTTRLSLTVTVCEGTGKLLKAKATAENPSPTPAGSFRYYFDNTDGQLTRGNGNSSMSGESASYDSFDYRFASNISEYRFTTTVNNVQKIRVYIYNANANNLITHVYQKSSMFTDKPSENEITPTITYSDESGYFTRGGNSYAEIILEEPLMNGSCLAFTTTSGCRLYGVRLYAASPTSATPTIRWANEALRSSGRIETVEGSGSMIYKAEVTTADFHSDAKMFYTSSDETVATVNETTGEVTVVATGIAPGEEVEATITAQLPASGCYRGSAKITYKVIVVGCTDKAGTITANRTIICPAAGKNADMTLSGYDEGAEILGWYKDGVLIPSTAGLTAYSATEVGTYYAVTSLSCEGGIRSNSIVVTATAAPTVNVIHPIWHVRRGRPIGQPIQLFRIVDYDPATMTTDITWKKANGDPYTLSGATGEAVGGVYQLSGTPLKTAATTSETLTAILTVTNECGGSTEAQAQIIVDPWKEKWQVAYIVTGTKGGGWTNHNTANAEEAGLYQYLAESFDVTACNAYQTTIAEDILSYYSQYDVIVLTDYPNSGTAPASGNPGYKSSGNISYSDALGVLVDVKPMLTMEAYVSGKSNWSKLGLTSNPSDGTATNNEYLKMTLLCPAMEIFEGTHEVGDVIQVADAGPTSGENKMLQGFHPTAAKDFIFIGTVAAAGEDTLITCCERQKILEARLIIFGLNFNGSNYVNENGKRCVKNIIDYLMVWDKDRVADCSIYFNNGKKNDGDHRWNNPENWGPGYNVVPRYYHNVRIEQPVIIDYNNAMAASVRVAVSSDNTVKGTYLEAGAGGIAPASRPVLNGEITIEATGALTINGGIYKVDSKESKKDFVTNQPLDASQLLINSSASGQGALAFGELNDNMVPSAYVALYSKAQYGNTSTPSWQYIGTPYTDAVALYNYYKAWLCEYHEDASTKDGLWTYTAHEQHVEPFKGYAITQQSPTTYLVEGKLVKPGNKTLLLDYTAGGAYRGQNALANSFTAPIYVRALEAADFDNANAVIYLYNTGKHSEWDSNKSSIVNAKTGNSTTAGQYISLPVEAVRYYDGAPVVIAPQQGFFVEATKGGSFTIDYDRAILCIDSTLAGEGKNTQPLRAPRRAPKDENIKLTSIVLESEGGGDAVTVLTGGENFTNGYENGWDARKWEGEAFLPYLSICPSDSDFSVSSQPQLEGSILRFKAAEGTELYKITIATSIEGLILHDMVTNADINLFDTTYYEFNSTNTEIHNRFKIVKKDVPTDLTSATDGNFNAYVSNGQICIDNRQGMASQVQIFDATGKLVYSSTLAPNSKQTLTNIAASGVYIIKATVKDETQIIKVTF